MPKQVFTAYFNRQLAARAFRAAIIDAFHLPLRQTLFAFDAHYSDAKFKVRVPKRRLASQ
ncbi:hypothetical protein [Xanthobacter autotrophicus]|uniref:hypothetical protein n=1 Tax=Xanthobacter autotrophicus TaxID=280 RepID=UPI0037272758